MWNSLSTDPPVALLCVMMLVDLSETEVMFYRFFAVIITTVHEDCTMVCTCA